MFDLPIRGRRAFWIFACLVSSWVMAGCGSNQPVSSATSKFEVAEESGRGTSSEDKETSVSIEPEREASKETTSNQAASSRANQTETDVDENDEPARATKSSTGLYKPPKGPPSAQMKFIKQVLEAKIGGNSPQSQKLDYEDKRKAAIASCGLILNDPKASNEEKRFAIITKFDVLTRMSMELQDDAFARQAMEFAAQLESKDKGTIENELGVAIGVSLLPQQFAMVEKPSAEEIKMLVSGYLAYLEKGPLPPMYQPGLQVAKMLNQIEQNPKAIQIIEAMLKSFTDAEEFPQKSEAVAELSRLLRLYQVDFTKKMDAALNDEGAFAALNATFEEILKDEGSKSAWLQFVYGVGATLEKMGKTESAGKVFARVATLNEKAEDPDYGKVMTQLLAKTEARKKLIGEPFDFTAEDGDRAEFKLSSLKGKPVVILFWTALDNGISFNELGNIQQTLLATKSAFDVVMVNVDDQPEIFKEFSEIQKVQWAAASVRCPDASKKGIESDLEKQIGLDQLPYSLLVDAEGKVVATFAQGARLKSLIASTLEPKEEVQESTEKKAEKEPAENNDNEPKSEKSTPENAPKAETPKTVEP